MEKHLKPKQYYMDLYDRITVEKGRSMEKRYREDVKKKIGNKKSKADKEKSHAIYKAHQLMCYFEIGERALNKEDKIKKWMEADRKRDELLESAEPPEGIYCLHCNNEMDVELRTLDIGTGDNEEDRVIFMFRCPNNKCRKGRAFYDDGEEYRTSIDLCEECGEQFEVKHHKGKNIVTFKYTCLGCGHTKIDKIDFSSKKNKPDKNYEKDLARFCLNEKQKEEYIKGKDNVMGWIEFVKEMKESDKNKDKIKKVKQLKKLTLVELENVLLPVFEKEKYVKFQLSQPEMLGDVRVGFTIQDAKSGRDEYQSRTQLKKLIIDTLKDANWRLMSEGISYKLGILSGRLRGYESEEDLVKLVSKNLI